MSRTYVLFCIRTPVTLSDVLQGPHGCALPTPGAGQVLDDKGAAVVEDREAVALRDEAMSFPRQVWLMLNQIPRALIVPFG